MHELGITEEIIRIIIAEVEQRSLVRVRSVSLTIGALTGFSPAAISYYFDILKDDFACLTEATLLMEVEPARLTCNACGAVVHLTDFIVRCPRCDSLETVRTGGEGLVISSIDAEEEK